MGMGIVTGENIRLSAPAILPVSLPTLREHLEINHELDDSLLSGVGGYLGAAVADVEKLGNISLIRQTRRQIVGEEWLSDLSGNTFNLNYGPYLSLVGVGYLDEDGAEQTLPTDNYRISADMCSIYFRGTLPTLLDGPGTIWVDYEAGYGDNISDVPDDWQNIIMVLAFHKYDNRGGGVDFKFDRMLDNLIVAAGGSRRG